LKIFTLQRKNKHKKNNQIWEKKKISARRTKVSTFNLYCVLDTFHLSATKIHPSKIKKHKKVLGSWRRRKNLF